MTTKLRPRTRTVYVSDGLHEAFQRLDTLAGNKGISFGKAMELALKRGLRMKAPDFAKRKKKQKADKSAKAKARTTKGQAAAKKAATKMVSK